MVQADPSQRLRRSPTDGGVRVVGEELGQVSDGSATGNSAVIKGLTEFEVYLEEGAGEDGPLHRISQVVSGKVQ
jgi:hypothetical protein